MIRRSLARVSSGPRPLRRASPPDRGQANHDRQRGACLHACQYAPPHEFAVNLPRALARGDWSGLSEHAPAAQLDVLQKLCHDLMARAAGAAPRFFDAAHLPPVPPWRALANWSRELLEAARTVEHPYQAGLLQEAWAARTRQVLGQASRRP